MAAAFDPSTLFSLQAGQIPPDQAQLQAQAQNQVAGIPAYLTPNQPPPSTPAAATPPPQAAGSTRPNMFMNAGGSTPQGIKSYLPTDQAASGYKQAAAQARLDQDANLDDIQKYINDLKSKGNGVDWSPLAALADSMNPGKSNLLAAAKETAPMSSDERDKMLANLQMSLGKERNQASQESLSAMAQQMNYEKQQQQMAETARHNSAMEAVGYGRNDSLGGRNLTMKDSQSQKAADEFDKNPILQNALTRQNQIGLDTHTITNPTTVMTPAIMDEVANGIANALQGGKSASLEGTKMQQIQSADKDFAKLRQYIADKPYGALSPENQQQLNSVLTRLHNGYGNIIAGQAQNIRKGRAFQYNDAANTVMDNKAAEYGAYGESSQVPSYEQDVLDYAKQHSITPAQAQSVKDSRTKGGQ